MALFAIRQVVNRSTGYSPHEFVFGQNVRGPLDLLYASWSEECYESLDVDSWIVSLQDRLRVLRETAVLNGSNESKKRADVFNKHASK